MKENLCRIEKQRGGEEQVPQRNFGCPIAGRGQVGGGFEQSSLVEGVPPHGMGVGTRRSLKSLSMPTFYGSMIL